MAKRHNPPRDNGHRRGGKLIPALLNLVGTLLMLGVIALMLPTFVPRLMGYEVYNVVSGSMAPTITTGSMVLVEPAVAKDVQEGDIIAFFDGASVVTHRVVHNKLVEGKIVTKGDANETEDLSTVDYSSLIGRVVWHMPMLGDIMAHITTLLGKIYLLALILCGLLLNIIAGRLRDA